jgi:hypothetical protein
MTRVVSCPKVPPRSQNKDSDSAQNPSPSIWPEQRLAKPFDVSKSEVWEAWVKVKGNKGASGVDWVSIEAFEKDLKGNLYKVRVATRGSGSCGTGSPASAHWSTSNRTAA